MADVYSTGPVSPALVQALKDLNQLIKEEDPANRFLCLFFTHSAKDGMMNLGVYVNPSINELKALGYVRDSLALLFNRTAN
jgi:hypothetical protein